MTRNGAAPPGTTSLQRNTTTSSLRWRTESEVLSGAGESTCGNTRCAHHDPRSAGSENRTAKSALVKMVLCEKYLGKMMWKKRKDKEAAGLERNKDRDGGEDEDGDYGPTEPSAQSGHDRNESWIGRVANTKTEFAFPIARCETSAPRCSTSGEVPETWMKPASLNGPEVQVQFALQCGCMSPTMGHDPSTTTYQDGHYQGPEAQRRESGASDLALSFRIFGDALVRELQCTLALQARVALVDGRNGLLVFLNANI
uniref:Uncharacterized protein n=1 Tax=Mycena chlorophos TaxID=658473 RepID=A0ABQ0LWS5_MYCCL|nr:predicted protein [Mycena chlorophos]